MTTAEAIQQLADKGDEVYAKVCKVISVDTTKRICDLEPLDGTADILEVRLQADIAMNSGFLMVPSVGSFVVANFLNKDAAVLALWSEVDHIELRGDEFGGLVKIEELIIQMNKIERKVNDFLAAYDAHTHTAPSGATGTPIPPETVTNLQETKKSQIENTSVTHG